MGAARPIRFFASGEYGEKRGRPHYHAILYGASIDDAQAVQDTWGFGHTKTVDVTPAAIAYVAGYTSKKIGDYHKRYHERQELVDPKTGEVYHWQPPFLQMSRRPGIGWQAKHKFPNSWRLFAIHNGTPMHVPRYLHDAWKQLASPEQQEKRIEEIQQIALRRDTHINLDAAEKIAEKAQEIKAARRKLE